MRRVLLCSTAVPWPTRPLLGIFHVHQANAVRALGGEMELFAPSPRVPSWLGRKWSRVRHQAARPVRYLVDGVTVHAPRVPFAFPPLVRQAASTFAPGAVLGWADRAYARALDAAIDSFHPDTLLAHGIVPWGEAVARAAERAGIGHAFIEHSAGDVMRLQPGTRLGRVCTAAARRARAVFVVGPQMQEHAENVLGWSNVALLPNGALRAPTAPRPPSLGDRRVVLAAANYYRRKGFEELVDAFARVAPVHLDVDLHLVTDAPTALRARIERRGVADRVVLHGPLPPRELLSLMAWAELFALPSWSEAFGLVYAEALAQGTPVLATTDSGFARYGRRWSETGAAMPLIAVPPRDLDRLTRALDVALARPESLAASVRSGERMVDAWFSWERNARTLLEVLGCDRAPVAQRIRGGTRAPTLVP